MHNRLKIGILVSGRGTNMQTILKSCSENKINAKVMVVITDNPQANAIIKAKEYNVPCIVHKRLNYKSKTEHEKAIIKDLQDYNVDLVCLAGYMRILGKTFLSKFANKTINIHPSLLPAFPGLNAQKQALDYKAKISGCTVHFVDEKMDHGPIILQASVQISKHDTLETLSAKILEQEHIIYPKAIELIATKQIKIDKRRVIKKF